MNQEETDFYKILGVKKDASDEEIKSAYKKKALLLHPDRHANKTDAEKKEYSKKFAAVSEAYSVLSDKEKRKRYDLGGSAAFSNGHFSNFDANSFFKDIFGSFSGFSNFGSGGFDTDFTSSGGSGFGNRNFTFFTSADANGMGSGTIFEQMMGNTSKSRRQQRTTSSLGPLEPLKYTIQVALDDICTGCVKKLKIKRKRNNEDTQKIVQVNIPQGVPENYEIVLKGEGDHLRDGRIQDVVITVTSKQSEFKRIGDDLECEVIMSMKEYFKNVKRTLTLPGNKTVQISSADFSKLGGRGKIKGYGLPNVKTKINGDLYVRVIVETTSVPKAKLDAIKKILD
ncbi:hypothetical protein EDEG_03601 [Edhazardia aedis USNM 41457]|uniref:J domain-containing protein n=1 Tax=Edhazardia aedis (strain USNM 41457) TaxID=1003232 RepID=J8ZQF5_EDHAE|nr:hypothetical protein EDEG_03601 [Edhazardia aedis USNM 41457]|eukprot:EJW01933.1 hypothetical protein EDEG_03601 [Edhazardia aedis USNM 41457]